MKIVNDIKFWLVISLTLGLAPFSPEPHVLGKIKWLLGGGQGMALMDYLDFVMHGFPWVMLFRAVVIRLIKK